MSPASSEHLDTSLVALLNAYGPPGREAGVRAQLRRLLRGAGDIAEDALGNLHVHRAGTGRRLLVTAHMDAAGIIVTRRNGEAGQARIGILGGRRAAEMVGAAVRFADERSGVVGWDRPGGKEAAEPEVEQLYVETGSGRNGRGKERAADVGDVAALEDRPLRLGDLWCAANLDNRAGCAALVEALTRARRVGYDVHAVFTTQSDLGARGATTSAFGIDPELAVVVDVAHLGDPKEVSGVSVGKGPSVALKEHGYLAHPEALELVRKAARSARVPLQHLIREGEGSDARAVRAARTGVPTAVIAIPARRTGGVWSLVHAKDLAQTVDLLAAVLSGSGRTAGGSGRTASGRTRTGNPRRRVTKKGARR